MTYTDTDLFNPLYCIHPRTYKYTNLVKVSKCVCERGVIYTQIDACTFQIVVVLIIVFTLCFSNDDDNNENNKGL